MPTFSEVYRNIQRRLEAALEVAPSEGFDLVEHAFYEGASAARRRQGYLETLEFPAQKEAALEEMVQRRLAGEPLAQILGHAWFYGRRFDVTRDVLIPRPDTEVLVEEVLRRVAADGYGVEVGVGSGCVMGTLLAERPALRMLGVEISPAAAQVAQANLEALGVAERGRIVVRDGLDGLDETFTLLVSNPPYVTDAEWENLEAGVRDFEPRLALTGGEPNPDGLLFYRRLALWGAEKLRPGGWLCMETGWQQAQAVRGLLQEKGETWHEITVTADLGGRERVVCARRA